MTTGQKSKPSYVYAIIGVSLVLFLLGTLGWLVINGRALTRTFKEDIEVQVVLHDNVRPEMADKLKQVLAGQPFAREVTLTTKEEAAKDFEKEWGEDFTQLLDFNPLYSSINLKLYSDYVNPDSLSRIEQFVKQSNIVREVSYPTGVVEKMNANFRKIGIILGAISLLLFIVVVILIDNTVRLAMFSNRFLIKTMQMVGATQWFITRPFDKRAVLNGFISGLLAVLGLWMVISFAENQLPSLRALHEPALLTSLMLGMIILGIIISVLSTHRSVVKYLKLHVDDLY
ncbi:MAG: cell division protein FtsX [Bacteroidetes bacterium]|nr:cell division protein FtsX [Bacteroidota bacterium]MBS1775572.1 cell division protein FtsX [Bacteroidota bacterium]